IGTGLWRRIASRISGIFPPVERSITVSAPKLTAVCSLSSSSRIFDVTAELPILALILHLVATPIPIGSSSGWLMLAGMISRPAAISSRISATGSFSRSATKAISSVTWPRRAKCICDMLLSPVRAASSFRFTIHSARGFRISCVGLTATSWLPFPLLLIFESPRLGFGCGMGCFGPISALEKIIRLDAKRLRLTEASYTPTLDGSDEDTSANTPHRCGRSDHPGHHHLPGDHRGSSGQELLRHHWRIAGHGQQGVYPSSPRSR